MNVNRTYTVVLLTQLSRDIFPAFQRWRAPETVVSVGTPSYEAFTAHVTETDDGASPSQAEFD